MNKEAFKEGLKVPYETVYTVYDSNKMEHIKLDLPHLKYLGYNYGEEFEDNYIFEAWLKFDRFSKGRSSVKAHFISTTTGCEFEMFLSDFEEAFKNPSFVGTILHGYFCFRKQGANFGVVLLEDYKG